jgi:hypothetical protein
MVTPSKLTEKDLEYSQKFVFPIYNFLKEYHHYSIDGLNQIKSNQQYILVTNHSLATYDILLLLSKIYLEKKVFMRPVVDKLLLVTPGLSQLMKPCHPLPASYRILNQVLKRGESIFIAPGGMKEALRSSEEKRKILWDDKRGFISLSVSTKTPILLAVCPQSDDLYDVKPSKLTKFMYEHFKFPFPIIRGRNSLFPFLPHKINLSHLIYGPFYPPSYEGSEQLNEKTDEFHLFIKNKMQEVLTQGDKKKLIITDQVDENG